MKKILIIILVSSSLFAIDYVDITFSNFLKELSHQSQKNIVISGKVDTNFNVFLPSFDHKNSNQIFKLLKDILIVNDLDYKITGNVILIYKLKPLPPVIEEIEPIIEEKLEHYLIRYKNLTPDTINKALSIFENIKVVPFKDRVLIYSRPSQIEDIKSTIKSIDLSYELRSLAVTILSTNNSKVKKLGSDFEYFKNFSFLGSSYIKLITSTATLTSNIESPTNFLMFINAMTEKGLTNIIYNPVVTILDGKDAIIESTTELPITTGNTKTENAQTVTTNTTSYKNVGLKLYISEVVIIDDKVSFSLDLYIESPMDNSDTPRIASKHIKTNVTLDNNSSFLLGGINGYESLETNRNIPLIENIPLINNLTRYKSEQINDYTYSVFITISKIN